MCKFCEFSEKMDKYTSNTYAEWNDAFIIYKTVDDSFILGCEFDNGKDYFPWENVEIKYCPFCGRKLGGE